MAEVAIGSGVDDGLAGLDGDLVGEKFAQGGHGVEAEGDCCEHKGDAGGAVRGALAHGGYGFQREPGDVDGPESDWVERFAGKRQWVQVRSSRQGTRIVHSWGRRSGDAEHGSYMMGWPEAAMSSASDCRASAMADLWRARANFTDLVM